MKNKFLTGTEIFFIVWIICIIAKLFGILQISWWLLLSPVIIYIGIGVLLASIFSIILLIISIIILIRMINGN